MKLIKYIFPILLFFPFAASANVFMIDGFEHGSTNPALGTSGTLSVQTTTKRTGNYALQINTSGAGYYELGEVTATGQHNIFSESNVYTRFYFRVDTLPSANDEPIVTFLRSGAAFKWELRINSGGKLIAYNTSLVPVATSTASLSTATWYRIEVFTNESDQGGDIEVYIDGVKDIDVTGQDTDSQAFGRIRFGKPNNRNSETINYFYDDISISDSALPGEGQIELMQAIADGTFSDFTRNTGSTDWEAVDENPTDEGTTYVEASSIHSTSTFELENSSTAGISGTINTLKTYNTAADAAGTNNLRPYLLSGSGFSIGTGFDVLVAYTRVGMTLTNTDPNTGSAWTTSGLDGIEVGMVAGSLTGVLRVSTVYAEVDFVPAAGGGGGEEPVPQSVFWFY